MDASPQRLKLGLDLPAGTWEAAWFNTRTGAWEQRRTMKHAGGEAVIESPEYTEDIALLVRSRR